MNMVLAIVGLSLALGLWSYVCGLAIDAGVTWYRRRYIRRVLRQTEAEHVYRGKPVWD